MKSLWPRQIRLAHMIACALVIGFITNMPAVGQPDLEGKARALLSRGHLEMARTLWHQVLAADPNNVEALAAMVRISRGEGREEDALAYLARLRFVSPADARSAEVEAKPVQTDPAPLVAQAQALRRAGQPARALKLYREAYGNCLPLGTAALAFYETQAATVVERPQAVAALRELVDRFPEDQRYLIELGRVLTYNAGSRAEGLKILAQFEEVADARQATEQALVWDRAETAANVSDARSLRVPAADVVTVSAASRAGVEARN